MYIVKNPRTGKMYKRRFYAVELKKATLPKTLDPAKITSYKIKKGKLWYNIKNKTTPIGVI